MNEDEKALDKAAAAYLKSILVAEQISYDEITKKLNSAGYPISYDSLRLKMQRGSFKLSFFLKCLDVMGKEIRIENRR